MVLEILNWILLAFLAVCNAAWIRLMILQRRPGDPFCKCCRNCPYDGRCPMQGERRNTP
ncbi:MAG: hypothetical protein IJ906_16155 [Oscillospiraceae bacterium]|jgi:hypothetical protein|nr:hypothetical protein [Oscillospiraceae bacterium]